MGTAPAQLMPVMAKDFIDLCYRELVSLTILA
jgi:hypothetical protein